ncbi:hypothetical protein IU421_14785 [Nocardia cyriacigeorgica]|uniref:hypothetical protein n=1 Tax=Nocardia cyriacigeorgica TaxID=135487 RepID=UPI0018937083|nr:hypothetical protein [Nocardia cyriacigeorgica]MBF6515536.1 hypothetical protein [Nocardia cyriacigeorgica]
MGIDDIRAAEPSPDEFETIIQAARDATDTLCKALLIPSCADAVEAALRPILRDAALAAWQVAERRANIGADPIS